MSANFVRPFLAATACLFLTMTMQTPAIAATHHWPLPANSLEQNGEPQPALERHHRKDPPPALPGGGLHKEARKGVQRVYSGAPTDVLTYHYDNMRTGWNKNETDLTPATVGSASFGQIATLNVDGNVFAQPLLVSNFVMLDGTTHNILVVVTGHNSVYAFDAQTYSVLWHVNLGPSQSSADVGCNDVQPEYGITSTPVILRNGPSWATIYVVAATEPAPYSFHTQLHALNLATGKDMRAPVEIAPTASISGGAQTLHFDPQNQWSRAALTFANTTLYVAMASHCDRNYGSISGWLLRYTVNQQPMAAFHTIEAPNWYQLASIWMTGFGPAVDADGKLFVVTGNGDYNNSAVGPRNYGESVLSLAPGLAKVTSNFTPAAYDQLNRDDTDFGSGGVMLIPPTPGQIGPRMAVTMGKDATLYLLNADRLGGMRTNDAGALQATRLNNSGAGLWGGPAYYGASGGRVYAQVHEDMLRAFQVSSGAKPALTQVATGTSPAGYGGSIPIVSSNATVPGTGVVWLVRRGVTEQLEAYDAMKLGAPLFAANAGSWSNPDHRNPFVTPLEGNGRVYVPGYMTVTVFGLTN